MSALVRIPDETKAKLDRLAEQTQQTRAALIVDALSALEERWFWKAFHAGYEKAAQDPQRWEALRMERESETGALEDGLE
jgi:predicted transcriptional regulator